MYTRAIQNHLLSELETDEIIVLTGMRRVGKTTLARFLFDSISSNNKLFIDLEDIINRKIFQEESYENTWLALKSLGINQRSPAEYL